MSEPTAPESAPLKCFVIMPFAETVHTKGGAPLTIVEEQWTHIFEQWVKKAVESFPDRKIVCKRSPATPGNFIKGIVQDLNASHLVVADLTGNRPNVYYELGIRNALRTGTVMITQDRHALPSDLQTYYCFEYTYTEKTHEYSVAYAAFEKDMHEKIAAILSSNFPSDNPVSDFINVATYFDKEKDLASKKQLLRELAMVAFCVDELTQCLARAEKPGAQPTWYKFYVDLRKCAGLHLIETVNTRFLLDSHLHDYEGDFVETIIKALFVIVSGVASILDIVHDEREREGFVDIGSIERLLTLARILPLEELRKAIEALKTAAGLKNEGSKESP